MSIILSFQETHNNPYIPFKQILYYIVILVKVSTPAWPSRYPTDSAPHRSQLSTCGPAVSSPRPSRAIRGPRRPGNINAVHGDTRAVAHDILGPTVVRAADHDGPLSRRARQPIALRPSWPGYREHEPLGRVIGVDTRGLPSLKPGYPLGDLLGR